MINYIKTWKNWNARACNDFRFSFRDTIVHNCFNRRFPDSLQIWWCRTFMIMLRLWHSVSTQWIASCWVCYFLIPAAVINNSSRTINHAQPAHSSLSLWKTPVLEASHPRPGPNWPHHPRFLQSQSPCRVFFLSVAEQVEKNKGNQPDSICWSHFH